MQLQGKWLTIKEFADLTPICVYHREHNRISLPEEPEDIHAYHAIFRKTFAAEAGTYMLRVSADDYYKFYINGRFLGQGPAQAYPEAYYFNQYDISDYIKSGENLIEAHVYHNGMLTRAWQSGDFRFGFIADVWKDGAFFLGTDDTWQYSHAPEYVRGHRIGSMIGYAENLDFTKKTRDWRNAILAENCDHVFMDAPVATVEVYLVKPHMIVKTAPGKYFFDLGTEVCGQAYFTMQGEKGQKVTFLYGEETMENDPYRARWEMRCNCHYRDVCTLSGGRDAFRFYDYKAFRYMNIESDSDNIPAEDVRVRVQHGKWGETADFTCSNENLNRVWELCKNTIKWGTHEAFLDCPSRERGQYLGDLAVSAPVHLYLTGNSAPFKKALYEFAKTCAFCPGMLGIAPGSLMQELADSSLQYPMVLLRYYRYTGDVNTLRELYPYAEGILEHFRQFEENSVLKNVYDKWNLVDWPRCLRDDYEANLENDDDSDHGIHIVINAWYIGATAATDEIRNILGMAPGGRVELLKAAFLRTFYDRTRKLFRDSDVSAHCSLHANVLPVLFDIMPEEATETVRAHLLRKGLSCGMLFSCPYLKALAKLGEYNAVYQTLISDGRHSWVNMLNNGATTCFEAWNKDEKSNISLRHPFGTAPILSIIEDIAGVSVHPSGEIVTSPKSIQGLSFTLQMPWRGDTVRVCCKSN